MERACSPLRRDDRVLVVRLGAVGDVLRLLPAVHGLRHAFPDLHLSWIVEELSAPLLDGHPDLDGVIVLARRELRRARSGPGGLAAIVGDLRRRLRRHEFTVALDFQSSFKSGVITRLSGAARRVGFSPGFCREMSFLFTTEWVPLSSPWLNRVDRNLELAAALGVPRVPPAAPLPETGDEASRARDLLATLVPPGATPVVLFPGASRRQSFKMWPPVHFGSLASRLHETLGIRPLVAWGPGEEALAQAVLRSSADAAVSTPPTSLRDLAAILRRSAVFVGADTGPMHLAWIVGCPVVALFGPTDPRLNAPLGRGDVVLRAPGGVMQDLSPLSVLEAVAGVLGRRAPIAAGRDAGMRAAPPADIGARP